MRHHVRLRSLLTATLFCVPYGSVGGQLPIAPPGRSSQLLLRGGMDAIAQRDESISPFRFDGSGPTAGIALESRSSRYAFTAQVEWHSASAAPKHSAATLRFTNAAAHVLLQRQFELQRQTRFGAGLEFRTSVTGSQQHLPFDNAPQSHYRLSIASLSPAVQVERSSRWGNALAQLRFASVSLVDRPYSALKSAANRLNIHIADPSRLIDAHAGVAFSTDRRRRFAMDVGYERRILIIKGDEPLHAAMSTVHAAVTTPLGRRVH